MKCYEGVSARPRAGFVLTVLLALLPALALTAQAEPPAAAGAPQSQPATTQPASTATQPTSERQAQIDALNDLIRQKLEARLKERVAQPAPPARPALPRPPAVPPEQAMEQGTGSQAPVDRPGGEVRAQANAGASDCAKGAQAANVDLTPPPPDAPQPKWLCPQPEVEIESVWRGEQANFTFEVTNGGEAPLNIRLKGG